MRIDIIADTICPWCYVGKARLERALAIRRPDGLQIRWRPFQLNPRMPPEGRDRKAYIAEKFGTAQRADTVYQTLREAGEEEGITFRFERIKRTPNTIDSHRLIALAGRDGGQRDVVDALFHAYFTEGRDIGRIEVLGDIAAQCGMERAAALDYLRSGDDRASVIAEDHLARNLGVNGVPCYLIDRKYAISGAQSPEVFVQVLDLARHDEAPLNVAAE